MPTSQWSQISAIVDAIRKLNPSSVLDIGVGFGKYGFLAREYLELWDGREKYGDWKRKIEGIEINGKYLSPLHSFIYDKIHEGDAMEILTSMPNHSYGLIMAIDFLEHLEKEKGRIFLKECMRAGTWTLISTPKVVIMRGEAYSNPHEAHKASWSKAELMEEGAKVIIRNHASWIALMGREPIPKAFTHLVRIKSFLRLCIKHRLY